MTKSGCDVVDGEM